MLGISIPPTRQIIFAALYFVCHMLGDLQRQLLLDDEIAQAGAGGKCSVTVAIHRRPAALNRYKYRHLDVLIV